MAMFTRPAAQCDHQPRAKSRPLLPPDLCQQQLAAAMISHHGPRCTDTNQVERGGLGLLLKRPTLVPHFWECQLISNLTHTLVELHPYTGRILHFLRSRNYSIKYMQLEWGAEFPLRLYILWNVVACPPRSLKMHQAGARGGIKLKWRIRKSVGPAVHFQKNYSNFASARNILATICYGEKKMLRVRNNC